MLLDIANIPNLDAAFVRVAASKGMAGVDGLTIADFNGKRALNLAKLARDLRECRYKPLPLLRFLVAKKDGTPRTLAVPTVRDRVAQAAVLNVIEPIFEAEFEDVSYAYRKGRSVRLAACRIIDLREQGYCYFIDLKGYLAGKRVWP